MITKGEPKGTVKEFIDFIMSAEGQKVVTEEGYIAVR
jgi:phosphate transport system substrate-binding protein